MIKTIGKSEIKSEYITSKDVYGSSPDPNILTLSYKKVYTIKIPINEVGIDFFSINKVECEGHRAFHFLYEVPYVDKNGCVPSDAGVNYLTLTSIPNIGDITIDYTDISLERELKINQILQ